MVINGFRVNSYESFKVHKAKHHRWNPSTIRNFLVKERLLFMHDVHVADRLEREAIEKTHTKAVLIIKHNKSQNSTVSQK